MIRHLLWFETKKKPKNRKPVARTYCSQLTFLQTTDTSKVDLFYQMWHITFGLLQLCGVQSRLFSISIRFWGDITGFF